MGRNLKPVCKLCRREGVKLFLKGSRCYADKCAMDRRGYGPGQHGQRRTRITEYRIQLREKQKLKSIYGIMEKQFRGYFFKADRKQGITGENLLQLLERRLDNIVYRIGFSVSRNQSRQMVTHGHFLVNGKKVDIPSYLIKEGDIVEPKEKSRKLSSIEMAMENAQGREIPSWLEVDKENLKGKILHLPEKEDIFLPVDEQMIVELCSR
ncbi:MAG: 30S ribosomal protein S4 [Nitrospirota bacterium]